MTDELKKFMLDDTGYETKLTKKFVSRKSFKPKNDKVINAFIPGTIRSIFVKEGQIVNIGDELLILEAMKMKNIIRSAINGKIKKVYVKSEQSVAKNELLIEFE